METKEPLKDEALTGSVEIAVAPADTERFVPLGRKRMLLTRTAGEEEVKGLGEKKKTKNMSKQGKWKGVEIKN